MTELPADVARALQGARRCRQCGTIPKGHIMPEIERILREDGLCVSCKDDREYGRPPAHYKQPRLRPRGLGEY